MLAVLGLVSTSATAVGGPFLGWIADAYGARQSLVVGGAVAVAAVAVATRAFVAARPEPAASVAPPVGDDTAMSVSAA